MMTRRTNLKFISVVEKKEQNLKSIQKIFTNQKTLPSRVCGVRGGEQGKSWKNCKAVSAPGPQ